MTERKRRRDLAPISPGDEKRAGALLDAELYNALVDFAARMDVDLAWIIRQAFREFIDRHTTALVTNPKQLALALGLWDNSQK